MDGYAYLECLLVHRNLILQTREVEVIFNELLRDLSKVLMAE